MPGEEESLEERLKGESGTIFRRFFEKVIQTRPKLIEFDKMEDVLYHKIEASPQEYINELMRGIEKKAVGYESLVHLVLRYKIAGKHAFEMICSLPEEKRYELLIEIINKNGPRRYRKRAMKILKNISNQETRYHTFLKHAKKLDVKIVCEELSKLYDQETRINAFVSLYDEGDELYKKNAYSWMKSEFKSAGFKKLRPDAQKKCLNTMISHCKGDINLRNSYFLGKLKSYFEDLRAEEFLKGNLEF